MTPEEAGNLVEQLRGNAWEALQQQLGNVPPVNYSLIDDALAAGCGGVIREIYEVGTNPLFLARDDLSADYYRQKIVDKAWSDLRDTTDIPNDLEYTAQFAIDCAISSTVTTLIGNAARWN